MHVPLKVGLLEKRIVNQASPGICKNDFQLLVDVIIHKGFIPEGVRLGMITSPASSVEPRS